MTQVDIHGCGGWAKIDCNGGCINIHKVLNSYLLLLSLSGDLQSGASSLAKHGGAYFSAVYGSIEDPVAAPGHCKPQVP